MNTIKECVPKNKVSFGPHQQRDFYSVVKERVENSFAQSGKSRFANSTMVFKTMLLLGIYVSLYSAIISNYLAGISLIVAYSLLGVTMGFIGFNICHDLMHGAYFANQKWNRIFSYIFDFNGMSSFVWKITHNLHHHTYTNIQGLDGDIDKATLLRLSPYDPLLPFHRFQHFYASFLYALVSLNWTVYADYKCLYDELKKRDISWKELLLFFFFKALNLFLLLLLPLWLLTVPAWQVIVGFLCLHFAGGLTSALVFQLGHVIEGVDFLELDEKGGIKKPWAEHEMATTSNFATSRPIWCYLFGGLNFQLEHHLFPFVCHVHYPEIASIVKKTALEFGLPYHEQPSLWKALSSHFTVLKKFGKGES